MSRDDHAVLITDAAHSQDDQRHSREFRYLMLMSIRIVAFIVGALLAIAHAPWPWLWAPLCVAGMVVVPWLAVVLANDRPPKNEHRIGRYRHPTHEPAAAGARDTKALRATREPTVIDAER